MIETQRVVLDGPLRLAGGAVLRDVEVAYQTYGRLSAARDNVVVLCHALTGDAHAAGHHGDPARRGWWDNLVGPGRAVDTDRFFVVSSNLLGGCQGTTGPQSIDPATGAAYGPDFPLLTVSDLVLVQRRLLERLGLGRVHAAVGGSLGGMQVLQWAIDAPGQLERAVVVAASSLLSAENIALSAVARHAITGDADFCGGRYAEHGRRPDHGLAVARRLAHVGYVSEQLLEDKFGRRRLDDGPPRLGTDFQVESYLDHQAAVFLERFDALTYLHLTRVMDYFDPFADPAAAERLRAGGTRFEVVSFDSDRRFPTAHSARIHAHLVAAGVASEHTDLASAYGHDSFLLAPPGYHELVRASLDRERAITSAG
ncbi:homoserine O-acetyltransferase [Marmoricola sp. Leaf446]|nr:homoserine O-acetyltransferase [Marmoricola sp. Leaf446]